MRRCIFFCSGFAALVQDNVVRMRRRDNDKTNIQQPMVPGQVCRVHGRVWQLRSNPTRTCTGLRGDHYDVEYELDLCEGAPAQTRGGWVQLPALLCQPKQRRVTSAKRHNVYRTGMRLSLFSLYRSPYVFVFFARPRRRGTCACDM